MKPVRMDCTMGVAAPIAQWSGEHDCTDSRGKSPGQCSADVAYTAGAVGDGFKLSGSGTSYVVVPDSPQLKAASAISLDLWINPSARRGRIVDKISANTTDGYLLDFVGDEGNLRFLVRTNDLTVATGLPLGRFTHVAAVYDGASSTVYLNGVRVGSKTATALPTHANTTPLHLGADSMGANTFSGVLDEVRIFDRALSANDVQVLYQQGSAAHCDCIPSAARPLSWWAADGDTVDSTGSNTARIVGNVSYAAGAVDKGFSFHGQTQSFVEIPNSATLQFANAFTLEAWVSPHASQGRIVDKIPANTISGFLLDYVDEHVRFLVGAAGPTTTDTPLLDAFHHMVGVFDGSQAVLYIDGERAAAMPATETTVPANTLPMRIGGDADGVNTFDGIVDEIRVYDRALSAADVRDIYSTGAAKRCK
jgi:hypothetical protein